MVLSSSIVHLLSSLDAFPIDTPFSSILFPFAKNVNAFGKSILRTVDSFFILTIFKNIYRDYRIFKRYIRNLSHFFKFTVIRAFF